MFFLRPIKNLTYVVNELRGEIYLMATLVDTLTESVTALTTAVNTAVADFTLLAQELTAALNEGDPVALQTAINNVNTLTATLSAAAAAAVPHDSSLTVPVPPAAPAA